MNNFTETEILPDTKPLTRTLILKLDLMLQTGVESEARSRVPKTFKLQMKGAMDFASHLRHSMVPGQNPPNNFPPRQYPPIQYIFKCGNKITT